MKNCAKGFILVAFLLLVTAGSVFAAGSLGEIPFLEDAVAAGEMPPMADRIPTEPYVVEPIDSIGRYGGTLRSVTPNVNSFGDDHLLMGFAVSWVKPDPDDQTLLPYFAKSFEPNEDKSAWTVTFRKGVKWSDGHPFSVDDVLFWYEDVLQNEDLTTTIGSPWRLYGEVVELERIDDYTVRFSWAGPFPYFPNYTVHHTGWSLVFPKHYLSQFHPDYVPEDELAAKIAAAGYERWYELFWNRNESWLAVPLNPDLPVLTGYKLASLEGDRRVYERNPYFWKVDTEGNQLPYVDRIDTQLVSDTEVAQGMIMGGAVDYVGMSADIRNFPLYRSYEEEGNYRTLLWTSGYSSEAVYFVNLTHRIPEIREIFQDVRFRRALSLAIDRQEISDTIYHGHAEPVQQTVLESSMFYEPEFATAYIEYDPDTANELLDEMGLDQRDASGWRLRPDGERLTFTIEYVDFETPKTPNVELVSQYWQEVGLDVRYREISGELQGQRAPGNLQDATFWHNGSATDVNFPIDPRHVVPVAPRWEECIWAEWARWFNTEGVEGEEPPDNIKQIRGWWDEMLVQPDLDRRIELGKKILAEQAENLWSIGTIGKAPQPIILNADIKNFPEDGLWAWGVLWNASHDPEQIYFDR